MQSRQLLLLLTLLLPVSFATAAFEWPFPETREDTRATPLDCYVAVASSEEGGSRDKPEEDEEPDCE